MKPANRAGLLISGVIGAVALASGLALVLSRATSPLETATSKRVSIVPASGPSHQIDISQLPLSVAATAAAVQPIAQAPVAASQSHVYRTVLVRQLRIEADSLYAMDNRDADARLETLAENLNATSAQELTRLALDSSQSQNERFLSVYVMGLRASRYTKELTQIAESQPGGQTEAELAVRLQAMSALDSLAAMEPGLTKTIFQRLESSHANPLLRKVARLGMKSVREGSPLIQKYLDMEVSEILDETN